MPRLVDRVLVVHTGVEGKNFPIQQTRSRGYKTFFMLNSTEHKILIAHKYENIKNSTIVGILTFMSRKNFMLNSVEHEKSFITSGPGYPHPVCSELEKAGKSGITVVVSQCSYTAVDSGYG